MKDMRFQFPELQNNYKQAKALRSKATDLSKDCKDIERVLEYRGLPYVSKLIRSKVINCHHNDRLKRYFRIDKTQKLISRKYYWPSLRNNIKNYVQGCNMYLASKAIPHKPYGNL